MKLEAIIDFAKFCEQHGFEWIDFDENDCRICLTMLVKE